MKFIRIKNNGIIEPQALHLVGASTKRNDSSKIGQFGSGNKYALAFFLRNGYNVKVFAGEKEIPITVESESFRDNDFNIICINGERTSITTEMGKDWQFWQAIREVYCNAIDEGGASMDLVYDYSPVSDETHFYIDSKKDVVEFFSNFDNYFATKKEVLFECKAGRILKKSGTEANVFRKGIKCLNTKKTSVFDYDFTNIQIDENRLVSFSWQVDEHLWDLIFRCTDKELILQILLASQDIDNIESCVSDIATINAKNISDEFKEVLRDIKLAPSAFSGLLKIDEVNQHVIIPTKVYSSVRGLISDDSVGDNFKISTRGGFYREVSESPLQSQIIKQAKYFLSESDFDIPYEIKVAVFEKKEVLGYAKDETIILSEVCLEKGVNEVVNTIIEEYIHIKHGVYDETRAFQTAIITEFISYMKKVNSFAI